MARSRGPGKVTERTRRWSRGSSGSGRTTSESATALQIAEQEGLDYRFEKTTLSDSAHPNTVRMTLERGDIHATLTGSSLGAGRVLVTEIDGYPVEVTGNFHTIALVAEDRKGSIARITSILAEHDINIATLRLTQKAEGRRRVHGDRVR